MAKRCDSCEIAYINGIRCHETGCPEAWRDQVYECFECGDDFQPDTRRQQLCQSCLDSLNPDYSDPEDEEYPDTDTDEQETNV